MDNDDLFSSRVFLLDSCDSNNYYFDLALMVIR